MDILNRSEARDRINRIDEAVVPFSVTNGMVASILHYLLERSDLQTEMQTAINLLRQDLDQHEGLMGYPGGEAVLDPHGLVPRENLPRTIFLFDGFRTPLDVDAGGVMFAPKGSKIFFDRGSRKFYLKTPNSPETPYYTSWGSNAQEEIPGSQELGPHLSALYIYNNELYVWNGSVMIKVASFQGVADYDDTEIVEMVEQLSQKIKSLQEAAKALNDLSDVGLTTPDKGDILSYDGSKWTNRRIDIPSLDGYATEAWVRDQKYLTGLSWEQLSGKPTWIGSSKPSYAFEDLTSHPSTLSGYGISDVKISDGTIFIGKDSITPITDHQPLSGYATQSWVTDQNYLTSSALTPYLKSEEAAKLYQSKGDYLTEHQNIYGLTFAAGSFTAKSYNPKSAAATVNIPTTTSHITEGSNLYFTNARAQNALAETVKTLNTAIGLKLDKTTFEDFKKLWEEYFTLENKDGEKRIRANYGLYTESFLSARGMNGTGATVTAGLDWKEIEKELGLHGYATQAWVEGKKYLTQHQSLANYYTKTESDNKYITKTTDGTKVLLANGGTINYYKASDITSATSDDGIVTPLGMKNWVEGKKYLASSSYTAADVLAKLKGVDGTGSGLDADLLDGKHRDNLYQGIEDWMVVTTGLNATVDLSASSYDQDTYYPVVGSTIPYKGMQFIKVFVQLNSGTTPTWGTHEKGFSCNLELFALAGGWGTTSSHTIISQYSCNFCKDNINPVGYSQLSNSSTPILWLRGGGKYFVRTGYNCEWSIKTATYIVSSQSVTPQKGGTAPLSINRATMHTNINGGASQLSTSRTLWGQSFNGTANVNGDMTGVGNIAQTLSPSAWTEGKHAYVPDMVADQRVIDRFGKSASAYNAGYIGYHFKAAGSTANYMTIGLWSIDEILNVVGTGRVGIGTPAPTEKLEVIGNIKATSGVFADQLRSKYLFFTRPDTTKGYYLEATTEGAGGLYIGQHDNFGGVGQVAHFGADKTFSVWGDIMPGSGDKTRDLGSNAVNFRYGYMTWVGSGSGKSFGMGANNATILTIATDGSASFKFTVSAGTKDSNGAVEIYHATPYIDFHFGRSSADYTTRLIEDISGRLKLIGTFYSTKGIFTDEYVSARGQNTSSDERLKGDIQPIAIPLDKIAEAPSVAFTWNDNGKRDVGSIAQYWKKVNPMFTPTNHDGYLTLQYGKAALLATITIARTVKSHEERIAELERENRELKKRMESLSKA